MHLLRWELIPPWAKDPAIGARLVNARSEGENSSRLCRSPEGDAARVKIVVA